MDVIAHLQTSLRPYDSRNGRHFDFTPFEVLGDVFICTFAQGFIRYSSSVALDTAQGAYSIALHFLRWLIKPHDKPLPILASLKSDHTKSSTKDWEDAVALWRDDLISQAKPGPLRKYKLMSGLNTLLNQLAVFGVIPKLSHVRPPAKLRRASRPTKCLAEVYTQNTKGCGQWLLEDIPAKFKRTDVEAQVNRDFLTTLLNETGEIGRTPEEQATALMKINVDRLALIRRCASSDFQKWEDHWLKGQRLLKSCNMQSEEIGLVINRTQPNSYERRRIINHLFPKEDYNLSLARLLKYIHDQPEYRGRVIRWPRGKLKTWLNYQAIRFGGIEVLQAYLFPHPEVITALITIILCDTGANVSVVRTLLFDCIEKSEDPGYWTLKGAKMRAGGKLIVNELPVKDSLHDISCIAAIQKYQKMSESLRQFATSKVADSLFLYIGWSGNVTDIDTQQWNACFRAFSKRHKEFNNLHIQSKMIRPSVLLQASFDKEIGVIAAGLIGDHASQSTTYSYIARFPNQVKWELLMRKFQSLFQIISIQSINDAAEKLGISQKQVKQLLEEANRTGLGVACLNPKAGIQKGSEEGKNCTQLQNCPDCPNRFVIATVENLKDLILWNHHLEQHRLEWEMTRPERWEKVWLPWLVFTQVAIEQAGRGRTVKEFMKAKALSDELIAKGNINLGPLW